MATSSSLSNRWRRGSASSEAAKETHRGQPLAVRLRAVPIELLACLAQPRPHCSRKLQVGHVTQSFGWWAAAPTRQLTFARPPLLPSRQQAQPVESSGSSGCSSQSTNWQTQHNGPSSHSSCGSISAGIAILRRAQAYRPGDRPAPGAAGRGVPCPRMQEPISVSDGEDHAGSGSQVEKDQIRFINFRMTLTTTVRALWGPHCSTGAPGMRALVACQSSGAMLRRSLLARGGSCGSCDSCEDQTCSFRFGSIRLRAFLPRPGCLQS